MTRIWSLLCTLLLVSAVSQTFAQDPRQEASVMQVEFSPDGTRLVACYYLHATNRPGTNWSCWGGAWDLKTGKGNFIPNVIVPLAFAPDGETIALGQPALRTRHPTITEVRLGLWKFGESKPQRIFDPNDIPPETPKVPGDSLSHKQAVPPPQTKEIVNAFNVTGEDSWVLEIAVTDVAHLDAVISQMCLLAETSTSINLKTLRQHQVMLPPSQEPTA